ncbi:Protein of unknown function [Gryllus bimaculatus]|nr:Protein of unknown function [Gryllus bimaculatus]
MFHYTSYGSCRHMDLEIDQMVETVPQINNHIIILVSVKIVRLESAKIHARDCEDSKRWFPGSNRKLGCPEAHHHNPSTSTARSSPRTVRGVAWRAQRPRGGGRWRKGGASVSTRLPLLHPFIRPRGLRLIVRHPCLGLCKHHMVKGTI